jgi:ribosome modulation factor
LDRWIEREQDFDDVYWEEIFDEGYAAFENGKESAEVPYEKGSEEFDTWLEGYRAAKNYLLSRQ